MKQRRWSDPAKFALIGVLLLYILLWFLCPQKFDSSDPWAYSQGAFNISESGDFGSGHVFDHRLAITGPTALIYKTFGVSIRTTNLVPLFSSLLIVLTVWLALPDRRSKIFGAVLCLTSVPLFKYSVALYPDLVAAAFMALSFYMLSSREKVTQGGGSSLYVPLAATTFLFVAFLAKLSAYWVLPVWMWCFVMDSKSSERSALLRHFYLPALITGVCLGVGYLIFCALIWDEPLARFKAIEVMAGAHLWASDGGSTKEMVERLTVSPARLLVDQYGFMLLSLALLGLVVAPRSIRPWGYYALSCLILFWFGSASLTRYEPLPLLDRMTLPLLPPVYIFAAFLTSRLSVSFGRPTWIGSVIPIVIVFGFIGMPFASYVNSWQWQTLPEANAMSALREEVENQKAEQYLLVTSDIRSPKSLSFYFGYQYPDNLNVVSVQELKGNFQWGDHVFVFANRTRSRFLKQAYGNRHYDAEIDALSQHARHRTSNIVMKKINKEKQLKRLIRSSGRPNH